MSHLSPRNRPLSILYRSFAFVTCFALFNVSVPYGAVVTLGMPIKKSIQDAIASYEAHKPATPPKSRPLSAKEQRTITGKTGECPYVAGQNKWDVIYKGVNMMSGNYSTSVTDLSFGGGYGIPVNVTRSYSANNGSDEPFGKGWSLSADMRSTAGGILKSKAAPVRSVPVAFQERHSAETDPNLAIQPAAAVIASDAAGKQETIQKDVDGILTTPPWDNNVSNPTYGWVTVGSSAFQVQTGNTTTTPDGTVYTYVAKGTYPSGTKPWNNPGATAQGANVLKITQVTDRQGNTTVYNYGATAVTFNKMDGQTSEYPLTSVVMPNGHTITFTWGNGTNAPTNKIVSITDGTRTVQYGYTNYPVGGVATYCLTSVTTPGGKVTHYGYGNAGSTPYQTNSPATNLLTGVTTPQGMTMTIQYSQYGALVAPQAAAVPAPVVSRMTWPNGAWAQFDYNLADQNGNAILPGLGNTTAGDPFGFGSTGGWGSVVEEHATGTSSDYVSKSQWGVNLGYFTPAGEIAVYSWNPRAYKSQAPYHYFGGGPTPQKIDYFMSNSEQLVEEDLFTCYANLATPATVARNLVPSYPSLPATTYTQATTAYNFMGNPLSKRTKEWVMASYPFGSYTQTRDATVSYAYWDGTKYFQQKATLDQGGRYTYTDYYPSTASAGSRGQQYQVFDPEHGGFWMDTSITVPSYGTGVEWKYQLKPTAGQYSAQFAFDSVGRCTGTYKLQKTTTNPWSYVHTLTAYGANNDGSWGQPSQVTEDAGGVNRITQTLHYTAWGKADKVQDATGHQFNTDYDLDGLVQSISRVDGGLNQNIANYSYGTTGNTVSYGQPIAVTEGLSGVSNSITYDSTSTDGGYGQVSQVSESGGPNASYSVNYRYNAAGERWQTTYTTPIGTTYWQNDDYDVTGSSAQPQPVFQTLTKLKDSTLQLTSEQFQYQYDTDGRLLISTFAQGPVVGFTPTGSNPWYDGSHQAASRARVMYSYDAAGRPASIQHYWDTWNSGTSSYGVEAILGNACAYEIANGSGLNRGLKTASSFYKNTTTGSASWTLDHTETYGYDANHDYLTGANYGDGLPNANPTWAYDAAQNRTDSVCDNLNRTTSVNGVSTTCDILGNRTALGSATYTWDCLNRMTGNSTGYTYSYRADGMRVNKNNATTTNGVTFRYDGQMGFEDVAYSGSNVTSINEYGLGARGVDYIERTQSATTTKSFPLYDAHGNMVATLFRSGSNYYSIGNQRSFDAWGIVRSGATTGDPKGRYCGSLGHKQDDETGLVYMRARYYEPVSGRFLSQDGSGNGGNWFSYCYNNPVNYQDSSGKNPLIVVGIVVGLINAVIALIVCLLEEGGSTDTAGIVAAKCTVAAVTAFAAGFACVFGPVFAAVAASFGAGLNTLVSEMIAHGGVSGVNWGKVGIAFGIGGAMGIAFSAVGAAAGENASIAIEIADQEAEFGVGDIAGAAAGMATGDAAASAYGT